MKLFKKLHIKAKGNLPAKILKEALLADGIEVQEEGFSCGEGKDDDAAHSEISTPLLVILYKK